MIRKHRTYANALAALCLAVATILAASADAAEAIRLSFGRIQPDESFEEVITFNNPTDKTLRITNIQLTTPLLAKGFGGPIPPGQDGRFTLTLGEDRPHGLYEGLIRINFDGGVAPLTFEVEGFVVPPIEIAPMPAFFVATHPGKNKTASVEIINHRDEPLALKGAESDSERFTTELETLEPGRRFRLSLTLKGTAEPGRVTERITLRAEPPLDPPLHVTANTLMRERVYTFPDGVDMGALPIEVAKDPDAVQTLSQILMVYRLGTDDFEVQASLDLDFISLVSERGPNGDRFQLTLTLIPEKVAPGRIQGAVRIETNDGEFGEFEVPVSGYILD